MKIKRYKYSLNCPPGRRMIRKLVNKLDFQKVFPYYSFDKERIDLGLVRQFLYQNKIPYYYLYTKDMMKKQDKEKENLSEKAKKCVVNSEYDPVDNRFEILDLESIITGMKELGV
ncbi:MAG: hypothetical protein ABGF52_11375 [Candidatus Asgardarchaeum sp.]